MPIKAVIFDMDGTLVDTEILYVKAVMLAGQDKGLKIQLDQAADVIYGKAWSDGFEMFDRLFPGVYPNDHAMTEHVSRFFDELVKISNIDIPGSVELLRQVSEDFPVAIVSGSSRHHIELFVDHMNIHENLQFYLGAEDYENGKPDPTCYLMAARRFGLDPGCCLVFEDSHAGVAAAKSAGMKCIALQRDSNKNQDLSAADQIISNLNQFDMASLQAGR